MKAQKRFKQFLITALKLFFVQPYGTLEFYSLTVMLFMPQKNLKINIQLFAKLI